MKTLIERKTGWLFGVGNTVATGAFGRPLFYMRVGRGRDGLIQFEVGNARRFLYAGKAER